MQVRAEYFEVVHTYLLYTYPRGLALLRLWFRYGVWELAARSHRHLPSASTGLDHHQTRCAMFVIEPVPLRVDSDPGLASRADDCLSPLALDGFCPWFNASDVDMCEACTYAVLVAALLPEAY